MKNYSFSNIAAEDTYGPRRSNDYGNYRHSQLKTSEANQRIEEIKKKYDTPNRRERIESMKRSKDVEMINRGARRDYDKENTYLSKDTYGNNYLKESIIATRLERSSLKKDIDGVQLAQLRSSDQDNRRSGVEDDKFKVNPRVEEEEIFSKVRQMKESLIHNERLKSSNLGKSYITSKHSLIGENKKEYDPRVENIDKINSKIKQILSCLNENQKNHGKYSQNSSAFKEEGYLTRQPSSYFNKQSACFGSNKIKETSSSKRSYESHFQRKSDVLEKINVFDPKTPNQTNQYKAAPLQENKEDEKKSKIDENTYQRRDWDKIRRDYSATPVQIKNKDYSLSKKYNEEVVSRTPSYLGRAHFEARTGKESRAKSQLASIRKSTLGNNQGNDVLKSGKKLNDEISRIQKKIQEFENAKRKLNIEFTPFTHSNTKSEHRDLSNTKSAANLAIPNRPRHSESYSVNKFKQASFGWNPDSIKVTEAKNVCEESNVSQKNSFCLQNVKNSTVYNHSNVSQSKCLPQEDIEVKLSPYDVKTFRIDKPIQINEEFSLNQSAVQYDEEAIKKRTDEGIEERKKRLQITDQIITTQSVKKLVELFCMQVKHDETLRNLKIWFESCFDSGKFRKIAKLLEAQGVSLSVEDCETAFTVNQSENNPFYSAQNFQGSLQALVSAYLQAMAHWQTNIKHKFERSGLISQGFSSQKIDLQKKGFIELEDIVRFVNIESGTFYRNRDIYLIFHRFTQQDKVNFESILGEICA